MSYMLMFAVLTRHVAKVPCGNVTPMIFSLSIVFALCVHLLSGDMNGWGSLWCFVANFLGPGMLLWGNV
jgi:hypothetical protein